LATNTDRIRSPGGLDAALSRDPHQVLAVELGRVIGAQRGGGVALADRELDRPTDHSDRGDVDDRRAPLERRRDHSLGAKAIGGDDVRIERIRVDRRRGMDDRVDPPQLQKPLGRVGQGKIELEVLAGAVRRRAPAQADDLVAGSRELGGYRAPDVAGGSRHQDPHPDSPMSPSTGRSLASKVPGSIVISPRRYWGYRGDWLGRRIRPL
jgi:hypothetical protein